MLRPKALPTVSDDKLKMSRALAASKPAGSRVLWVPLLGLLLGMVAGCGGNEVNPVQGKIVYSDGSPATDLENYAVTFELTDGQATSDQPGVSAAGIVKADGTFTVSTYETNDGAVPGKHRVSLSPPVIESDETFVEEVIDPKFYAFETSGLEATITSGTNEVKLTIQRRKRK